MLLLFLSHSVSYSAPFFLEKDSFLQNQIWSLWRRCWWIGHTICSRTGLEFCTADYIYCEAPVMINKSTNFGFLKYILWISTKLGPHRWMKVEQKEKRYCKIFKTKTSFWNGKYCLLHSQTSSSPSWVIKKGDKTAIIIHQKCKSYEKEVRPLQIYIGLKSWHNGTLL